MSTKRERLHKLAYARYVLEGAYLDLRKDGSVWRAAWKARDAKEGRARAHASSVLFAIEESWGGLDAAIEAGVRMRASALGRLLRKNTEDQFVSSFTAQLTEALGKVVREEVLPAAEAFEDEVGREASDWAVEALLRNQDELTKAIRSWGAGRMATWEAIRGRPGPEFPSMTEYRMGKYLRIGETYNHNLARVIWQATHDPEGPWTLEQVRGEIGRLWPDIRGYRLERLARTELTEAWEKGNRDTLVANGVQRVRWLIASGPQIPPPGSGSGAVCPRCLENAAAGWLPLTIEEGLFGRGPVPIRDQPRVMPSGGSWGEKRRADVFPTGHTRPPAHANCRCTLIPDVDSGWHPPPEVPEGTNLLDDPSVLDFIPGRMSSLEQGIEAVKRGQTGKMKVMPDDLVEAAERFVQALDEAPELERHFYRGVTRAKDRNEWGLVVEMMQRGHEFDLPLAQFLESPLADLPSDVRRGGAPVFVRLERGKVIPAATEEGMLWLTSGRFRVIGNEAITDEVGRVTAHLIRIERVGDISYSLRKALGLRELQINRFWAELLRPRVPVGR